jgi:hypothetical protein
MAQVLTMLIAKPFIVKDIVAVMPYRKATGYLDFH